MTVSVSPMLSGVLLLDNWMVPVSEVNVSDFDTRIGVPLASPMAPRALESKYSAWILAEKDADVMASAV